MNLPYKEEWVDNPDGIACRVLDQAAVDFSDASYGRKATETLVKRAKGGEVIETKHDGIVESTYTAQEGDAIFENLHNPDDRYVPGNSDGTRWKFNDVATKGYEITSHDPDNDAIRVKSANTAKLLVEAVTEPTCIKDAWGEGQHQFLFEGATLKQGANGRVTGIEKEAFDATWEIVTPPAHQVGDPLDIAAKGHKP